MSVDRLVADASELRRRVRSEYETRSSAAIRERGRFLTALPGGSVAEAFLPSLAASAVDWTRTDVFWTDERAVHPDHPDSNYAVAARLLLGPARVPVERVHRLHGEFPDLEQAARRDADELRSIAGDPPRLDLVLAGVGEDGHVASIFPAAESGVPAAAIGVRPVIAIRDAPKPPAHRLSLAMPVLASAGLIIVAAFGRSKANAVRDALGGDGHSPFGRLLRSAARPPLVLLDRDAAELLS